MRPLALLWLSAALLGCGRLSRPVASGATLEALPRLGRAPLLALLPPEASVAMALANPAASLAALEQTALWKSLSAGGDLDDLRALAPVERWQALQARLGELARLPLPGLESLLGQPLAAAWVPEAEARRAGWLAVCALNAQAGSAWELAKALFAVRPSGREVELERVQGVPVRELAFGEERLAYALLGDRLIAGSEGKLVARAVGQALALVADHPQPALLNRSPFAELEDRAKTSGVALAFADTGPDRPARWLPGVERVQLVGSEVTAQLDAALWSSGNAQLPPEPNALVSAALPGLALRPVFERLRSGLPVSGDEPLWGALLALADPAARGAQALLLPWEGTLAGVFEATRVGSDSGPVLALGRLLLDRPGPPLAAPGGTIACARNDALCLLACDRRWRLAWPGSFARARGCPAPSGAGEPVALRLALGPPGRGLVLALRDGQGTLELGENAR